MHGGVYEIRGDSGSFPGHERSVRMQHTIKVEEKYLGADSLHREEVRVDGLSEASSEGIRSTPERVPSQALRAAFGWLAAATEMAASGRSLPAGAMKHAGQIFR